MAHTAHTHTLYTLADTQCIGSPLSQVQSLKYPFFLVYSLAATKRSKVHNDNNSNNGNHGNNSSSRGLITTIMLIIMHSVMFTDILPVAACSLARSALSWVILFGFV